MPSSNLGFLGGALSVFRGIRFLVATPRVWPFAAAPVVVLTLLFGAFATASLRYLSPALMPDLDPSSTLGRLGTHALRGLISVLSVVAAALVAAWCTPTVSGPALERIIVIRERQLGAPERPATSFVTELACGLRAQLFGLVVGAPVLGLLWGVTLFAPPLAVVTFPLKLLTLTFLVAWNLLDYPLSLRGLALRERLALFLKDAPTVFGFGAGIAALFAIPLGAIVLLPAGVAAATEISAHLLRRSSSDGRSS